MPGALGADFAGDVVSDELQAHADDIDTRNRGLRRPSGGHPDLGALSASPEQWDLPTAREETGAARTACGSLNWLAERLRTAG